MKHHALCHVTWMDAGICAQCNFIAKVEAQMLSHHDHEFGCDGCLSVGYEDGYSDGLVAALKAVHKVPRPGVYHKDWIYVDHATDAIRKLIVKDKKGK
jgi:hypothetical protein